MARPCQLISSEPGCRLTRVVEGELLSEPLIAWALCLDGLIRPVSPNGVNGGGGDGNYWVAMPDGSIQAVGEYTEPICFANTEEMIRNFMPASELDEALDG